jgi:hypothetical protein
MVVASSTIRSDDAVGRAGSSSAQATLLADDPARLPGARIGPAYFTPVVLEAPTSRSAQQRETVSPHAAWPPVRRLVMMGLGPGGVNRA